jgi:hypothetical protein
MGTGLKTATFEKVIKYKISIVLHVYNRASVGSLESSGM